MSTRNRPLLAVTIAATESLSAEIDLRGYEVVAIHMPAAWTAANLTFQAATQPGGTYADVHDDEGAEITVTAAAGHVVTIGIDLKKMRGLNFIRVRSGTSGTAVAQAAERTIYLALKG